MSNVEKQSMIRDGVDRGELSWVWWLLVQLKIRLLGPFKSKLARPCTMSGRENSFSVVSTLDQDLFDES